MRRVMVAFALVALAIFGNGCATGVVYMTPKDAPHGYVEFYTVPSYAETLNMPIGIDVTVAQTFGGERKVLGKSLRWDTGWNSSAGRLCARQTRVPIEAGISYEA